MTGKNRKVKEMMGESEYWSSEYRNANMRPDIRWSKIRSEIKIALVWE